MSRSSPGCPERQDSVKWMIESQATLRTGHLLNLNCCATRSVDRFECGHCNGQLWSGEYLEMTASQLNVVLTINK